MGKLNVKLTASRARRISHQHSQLYSQCSAVIPLYHQPLRGKRKVKINLIRVNSVHSKENSGILPRVSLSSQLCGQRARGLEPGGPKLEFWLSLSCITMAQLSKGRKCHCLTEPLCGSMRKDIKAMKPLMDIKHSARFPLVPHGLQSYPPTQLVAYLDISGGGPRTCLLHPQILPPAAEAGLSSGGGSSREGGSKNPATPNCQHLSQLLLSYLIWTWAWQQYFYYPHFRDPEKE